MDKNEYRFSTALMDLLWTALWLGLLDSFTAFFWDRARPISAGLWWSDLPLVLLPGTAIGALTALLLMTVPLVAALVLRRVSRRRKEGRLYRHIPRLLHPAMAVLLYAGAKLILFKSVDWALPAVPLALVALVAALLLVPRIPQILEGAGMFLLSLLAAAALSHASGRGLFARVPLSDALFIGLTASAVPVFLWGLRFFRHPSLKVRIAGIGAAVLLSAGALFFAAPRNSGDGQSGTSRPDVLLLVVDTLRSDRVWGETARMPRTAALARTGITFRNARTPFPKTHPSVAAFLTGRYPWTIEVENMYRPVDWKWHTIAEAFADGGYDTAAFVHNPWIDNGMGHEQGFDEYVDAHLIESVWPRLHRLLPVYAFDSLLGRKTKGDRHNMDGATAVAQIVARFERRTDHPLFTWVQLFDPHWPYEPPRSVPGVTREQRRLAAVVNHPGIRKIPRPKMIFHLPQTGITPAEVEAARAMYDAECRYTDGHVDRIVRAFRERAKTRGKEGIILFVSDHGESLGEHGYYFHHGDNTWEETLHVPLIVSWPGRIPEGVVSDASVSTLDIYPTLAALAGVRAPADLPGHHLPGIDQVKEPTGRAIAFESDMPPPSKRRRGPRLLLPLLSRKDRKEPRWRGVLVDDIKLSAQPDRRRPRIDVFDMKSDPREQVNLYPGVDVAPLVQQLEAEGLSMEDRKDRRRDKPVRLSDEEQERLKELGYIQ